MAKKPTNKQILAFMETLTSFEDAGEITLKQKINAYNKYETGLISKNKILADLGIKTGGMSEDEYKMKTDLRNQKTFGEGRILDKKKGGGHVKKYTGGKSGDKYYGGGPVYPRPTKSN